MSSDSEDTEENETWIQWFCRLKGNEFFCEVDKAYIEDGFNLYGLRQAVSNFQDSLDIILDRNDIGQEESEAMTSFAMQLYGLIHARYILTTHGLAAMHHKYLHGAFGKCPRHLCAQQSVVPLGHHCDPHHDTVKIYCPKCGEVYSPGPTYAQIDGASFGPTFPPLFFMTYGDEVPADPPPYYVPRVYGFKVYRSSPATSPALHHRLAAAAASTTAPAAGFGGGGGGGSSSSRVNGSSSSSHGAGGAGGSSSHGVSGSLSTMTTTTAASVAVAVGGGGAGSVMAAEAAGPGGGGGIGGGSGLGHNSGSSSHNIGALSRRGNGAHSLSPPMPAGTSSSSSSSLPVPLHAPPSSNSSTLSSSSSSTSIPVPSSTASTVSSGNGGVVGSNVNGVPAKPPPVVVPEAPAPSSSSSSAAGSTGDALNVKRMRLEGNGMAE